MQQKPEDYCIIILAAGSSSRLGTPKQLLPFKGKKLIQHIVEVALEVVSQVIVVTGASKEQVEEALQDYPVQIAYNENYKDGIASSVRTGINAIAEFTTDAAYALFLVCDQPFVTASLLEQILERRHTNDKVIVASAYKDTVGVPAVFHKHYFPDLLNLKGDAGAKKIILAYPPSVIAIPFEEGNMDIDTKQDYEFLKQQVNEY